MKTVTITFEISDDEQRLLGLGVDWNETSMPEDTILINKLCFTTLKAMKKEPESFAAYDLINEINSELED